MYALIMNNIEAIKSPRQKGNKKYPGNLYHSGDKNIKQE